MHRNSTNQSLHSAFVELMANRFEGKRSLNVVFAFNDYMEIKREIPEPVKATLRVFRNKLNQLAFGNASRKKRAGRSSERSNFKEIAFTAAVHTKKYLHVHCQIEIPSEITPADLTAFIREFVTKNRWIAEDTLYIEETKSNIATQKYNTRYGIDTIILF